MLLNTLDTLFNLRLESISYDYLGFENKANHFFFKSAEYVCFFRNRRLEAAVATYHTKKSKIRVLVLFLNVKHNSLFFPAICMYVCLTCVWDPLVTIFSAS